MTSSDSLPTAQKFKDDVIGFLIYLKKLYALKSEDDVIRFLAYRSSDSSPTAQKYEDDVIRFLTYPRFQRIELLQIGEKSNDVIFIFLTYLKKLYALKSEDDIIEFLAYRSEI